MTVKEHDLLRTAEVNATISVDDRFQHCSCSSVVLVELPSLLQFLTYRLALMGHDFIEQLLAWQDSCKKKITFVLSNIDRFLVELSSQPRVALKRNTHTLYV